MYKKLMTYEDFDGNERTEELYFNLTEQEVTEYQLSHNGGITTLINRIIQAQDWKSMVEYWKEFILMCYGVKSDDGRRFVKNDIVREEFASTNAFSDLFMLLSTDDNEAAKFVNNVLPKKMRERLSGMEGELKDIRNASSSSELVRKLNEKGYN